LRARFAAALVVAVAAVAVGGCGGGEGGGSRTINWYVASQPGGGYDAAVANCNKQFKGRFQIKYQRLPTDANQQRELLVRRLAANDSSIDLVGMDIPWTAEFAQAKWILPWQGANRAYAVKDKLTGPLRSVKYKNKVWAVPFTSNTQLLWYRKDKVKKPPTTWSQMIDDAVKDKSSIAITGRQYEGLSVLVNSLIASAGGQIVDENGNVKVDATAATAAKILNQVALKAAAPGLNTAAEDDARLAFETGAPEFEVNYPFIYPSAAEKKGFQKKIGWARFPRVDPSKPSRPPLGGFNIAVSAFTKNRALAFKAARCIASLPNQAVATEKEGLPPTTASVFNDPKVKKAYPFATLLRQSLDAAAPRPVIPSYSDVSLAIQKTYHPEDKIDPNGIEKKLRDRLKKAAEGKIF
jgi:multiple sugar transport system substrate-binding protein